MNKVLLTGRQTKRAEVRATEDGLSIARFTLAVDRKGEGTDFPSCVAFGKTADFIDKYGDKGKKWLAEGRIQTGSYTNKDRVKVYTTEVVVESLEFGESKKAENPADTEAQTYDDFMAVPDEELPFA